MLTIPEKSRQGFSFIFEDENLERFTPASVRYRLHDPERNVELIPWTDVTPAETVNVIIPASANRILMNFQAYELRVLTVQSDYDTDSQLSEDRIYRVKNLPGFQ